MDKLVSMVIANLKGHKVGYVLLVLIGIILVTDTPLRDAALHLVNIGTHSQQLKVSDKVDALNAKADDLLKEKAITSEQLSAMQVFQWQSIITNEALPVILRLQAYDAYTASGHNSWVHDYYEAELKPLNNKSMKYRLHDLQDGYSENK